MKPKAQRPVSPPAPAAHVQAAMGRGTEPPRPTPSAAALQARSALAPHVQAALYPGGGPPVALQARRAPAAAPSVFSPSAAPARAGVIQRASRMEESSYSSSSEEELLSDAWSICQWLATNDTGGQASNYSVGLCTDGTIIISKVGGVTGSTALMKLLKPNLDGSLNVYLAKKFSSAGTSGCHGEMCVYAGATALGRTLKALYCTHDNCAFCAKFLGIKKVGTGSVVNNGAKTQQAWYHPELPLAYGSQLKGTESNQVQEMAALTKNGGDPVLGQTTSSFPGGSASQFV